MEFVLMVWGYLWPVLLAVLLFLALIIIHELGHFIFAKLNGVKVNEFAVGFGPKLFKKVKGETEYSFRAVPFGGLCAMEGEDEDSTNPRALNNKKVWQRLTVMAGGAFFNLVFGLLITLIVVIISFNLIPTTTVAQFHEKAVSNSEGGLQVGDEILAINGRSVYTVDDLGYMLSTEQSGVFTMQVLRDNKKVTLDRVTFATEKNEKVGRDVIVQDFKLLGVKKTFGSVVSQTFSRFASKARVIWMSLIDLMSGKFRVSELSGPVGLVQNVSEAVKIGPEVFFDIASLITINLGIMNLLPLPALDGGRIVFLIIEGIRRKPVPAKYEGIIHAVGFVLLLGLIAVVTFSDILKLF